MASEATRSVIYWQAIVVVVKVLSFSLQAEDDPVLVASSSIPLQQDPSPPRVSQGAFQALPYFGSMQQFHQGEPLHQSLLLHLVMDGKHSMDFNCYRSTLDYKELLIC